jgi:hypothetical protein
VNNGVKACNTAAYHQQADGLAERTNQTMITMIRQYLEPAKEQRDWASQVAKCVFAYNTAQQSSLKETPFYLMHGFHPNLPAQQRFGNAVEVADLTTSTDEEIQIIRRQATDNLGRSQLQQKEYYDQRHAYVEYYPGDDVLI